MEERYIEFVPGVEAGEHEGRPDLWFVFHEGRMLVKGAERGIGVPVSEDLKLYEDSLKHIHYLGELEGRNCYTAELDDEAAVQGEFRFENLRSVLDLMDEKL
ncbi:MAG: NUDIX-like domain-containing protein, partial [Bacillota bacterium]|nr:NUDIX-like domain-containing protein [Bacillota bacterium]